jgi:hypothetical protein
MKKVIFSVVCASWLAMSAFPSLAAGLTYGQLVEGLDGSKNTKLAAKENWKRFKGQEVTWSGVVYEVDSQGSKEAKLFVADRAHPLYKGYNMRLYTRDVEKAYKLKKGQAITFTGTIDDFRSKEPGVVVDLQNVKLP